MTERLPPAPHPDALPGYHNDELLTLDAGQVWARLYFHSGTHPTSWDGFRTAALAKPSRFDAFGAPTVDGVAYGAVTAGGPAGTLDLVAPGDRSALATCVAEAAQATKVLDRLDQRSFAVAELNAPLVLLDVSSDWATRAGAGIHLSAAPRVETSQWAVSIATRWPNLHGVAYRASTRAAGRALALWAPRCTEEVTGSTLLLVRRLDDPAMLVPLSWAAERTGTDLLPAAPR